MTTPLQARYHVRYQSLIGDKWVEAKHLAPVAIDDTHDDEFNHTAVINKFTKVWNATLGSEHKFRILEITEISA